MPQTEMFSMLVNFSYKTVFFFFCFFVVVVFLHVIGQEYPAIVEFAPFQKVAKKRSKKKDAKSGTIEDGNHCKQ